MQQRGMAVAQTRSTMRRQQYAAETGWQKTQKDILAAVVLMAIKARFTTTENRHVVIALWSITRMAKIAADKRFLIQERISVVVQLIGIGDWTMHRLIIAWQVKRSENIRPIQANELVKIFSEHFYCRDCKELMCLNLDWKSYTC